MHVLIIIITLLGSLIWVVTRFMNAAQDGKAAFRKFSWSNRIDKRLIEHLNDPRESAGILLVQIATYKGEVTRAQHQKILDELQRVLSISLGDAEGFYGFGRIAVGQLNDAANQLTKIMAPILQNCTLSEMADLITMLENVAECDGPANDRQRELMRNVRKATSMNAPHA